MARALKLREELVARCDSEGARQAHAGDLAIEIGRRLAAFSSFDAHALLRANEVPCEIPAREPIVLKLFWEDWAIERGLVVEQADSLHGRIREIGLCMRLSETPGQHKGPAPRIGQHTAEILAQLGYARSRIDELATKRVVFRDVVAE